MKDLSIKQRVWGAVLIVVLAVLFIPIILLLESQPDAPAVPAPDRPPAATLRAEVDGHADKLLDTYGWVDREKGLVRIPVDRARELWLAENGGDR